MWVVLFLDNPCHRITGTSFWSHKPPACWIPFIATLWALSFHDVDMMLRYIPEHYGFEEGRQGDG